MKAFASLFTVVPLVKKPMKSVRKWENNAYDRPFFEDMKKEDIISREKENGE